MPGAGRICAGSSCRRRRKRDRPWQAAAGSCAWGSAANAAITRLYLYTFAGLDSARRLYEQAGFKLKEEQEANTWGRPMREQRFEAELLPDDPFENSGRRAALASTLGSPRLPGAIAVARIGLCDIVGPVGAFS